MFEKRRCERIIKKVNDFFLFSFFKKTLREVENKCMRMSTGGGRGKGTNDSPLSGKPDRGAHVGLGPRTLKS